MQPQQPPKPVGASPRVTKRRAETRANLIEAAYRVFADKGFGQVRIDDVCAAAGYTRGAFYSNFATLDELFFALYVAPLLLAAFGWAVALWAVRQAKKESRPPAE